MHKSYVISFTILFLITIALVIIGYYTPVVSLKEALATDYSAVIIYSENCGTPCSRLYREKQSLPFGAEGELIMKKKSITDPYYKSLLRQYNLRSIFLIDEKIIVYPRNYFGRASNDEYELPLSDKIKRRMECNEGNESYATYIICKKLNRAPFNIPYHDPRLGAVDYSIFFPDRCAGTFLQRGEDIASYQRLLSGNVFTIYDIYSGNDLQEFIDKELAKEGKIKYDRCFGSLP